MLLSEHVYCVPVTFKMTEWVDNKSASNFVLSLNIPLQKLFIWFRRLQLWVTGDWQLHHDNTPTHASCLVQIFLMKYQATQVTQPRYSPGLVPCNFWLFPKLKSPKTKITFEREEISDCQRDSGKYDRAADSNWENCVRSQGAYFEGDWGIIALCTMLLFF